MNCPKCLGKLEEKELKGNEPVVIDQCFACAGIWFDKDELNKVIRHEIVRTVESELTSKEIGNKGLRETLDHKSGHCPRCGDTQKMIRIRSARNPKVMVDHCQTCDGLWLDGGEYEVLRNRNPLELTYEKMIDFLRVSFPSLVKVE